MARICGVDIPANKKIKISLTYVFGIGNTRSVQILNILKINPDIRTSALKEEDISIINKHIEKNDELVVAGDLRRNVQSNIARLKTIKSYRGLRHTRGLPTRGQRTKNNARTRKGKKKTVAGKKG